LTGDGTPDWANVACADVVGTDVSAGLVPWLGELVGTMTAEPQLPRRNVKRIIRMTEKSLMKRDILKDVPAIEAAGSCYPSEKPFFTRS
jgi:hypothetical protein